MPAFVIMMRESTNDPNELKTYGEKAAAASAGHALKPVAIYGRHEVLEGPPVEGVVILEFPTFDAAKAWYHSPAYQEAAGHRFKGATYRGVIVEGI